MAACTHHIIYSQASIERLFDQEAAPAATHPAAKRFIGSDTRPGDVAAHTKRLLREHCRGK